MGQTSIAGAIAFGAVGAFLAHKALPPIRTMLSLNTDQVPKRPDCPQCGGTDYFNGYGVCQRCEIF